MDIAIGLAIVGSVDCILVVRLVGIIIRPCNVAGERIDFRLRIFIAFRNPSHIINVDGAGLGVDVDQVIDICRNLDRVHGYGTLGLQNRVFGDFLITDSHLDGTDVGAGGTGPNLKDTVTGDLELEAVLGTGNTGTAQLDTLTGILSLELELATASDKGEFVLGESS